MAGLELIGALKALRGERVKIHSELAKLDRAITALEGLAGTKAATSNRNGHQRTLSAAARNKIAKAQKLRWAKVKRERAGKA